MKISPSYEEFKAMAKEGNIIPVFREFLGDIETPVSAYFKISDKKYSYLLESAELGEEGRYSFIGYKPYLVIKAYEKEVHIERDGKRLVKTEYRNPFDVLKSIIREFNMVSIPELSPFQGGFVGYVNYDLIRKWERLPMLSAASPYLPEFMFVVSRRLIVFDHLTHTIKVTSFAYIDNSKSLKEIYDIACKDIDETIEELRSPLPNICGIEPIYISQIESNFKKSEFESAVKKAKDYIVAGDIIQVVLSQRFSGEIRGDDFQLYRHLRSINPSPYMFYLNFDNIKLIGASPETLVKLTDGKIEVRPIAGTRPRGKDIEADKALEMELLSDPKERAEHIMLVDLGRNDVGKVSMPATVKVPRLMEIERYSHVMHIVSVVEGIKRPDVDEFDVFMATFPAGTVSGAPKIRAMEIIAELEGPSRGPYAGGVGYFGFNENMDFCITIRTISVINNRIFVQAGAGIVYDSIPEMEYEETMRKGGAMFKAIERATGKEGVLV
ncbi:MAG: anthranilate synthase component I [Deltaproteobacteria bacterium]|nr:MAG: anthranilate synthase component I [Deltaproteobacteria bacterium]